MTKQEITSLYNLLSGDSTSKVAFEIAKAKGYTERGNQIKESRRC